MIEVEGGKSSFCGFAALPIKIETEANYNWRARTRPLDAALSPLSSLAPYSFVFKAAGVCAIELSNVLRNLSDSLKDLRKLDELKLPRAIPDNY